MLSRRDFLQVTAATAAMLGAGANISRAATGQKISQEEILKFKSTGQVTLLNFTDIHAQLVPIYFREPSMNIGVGDVRGLPPHITGNAFLKRFGIKPGTPEAYAFSSADFVHLGREYGRLGGLAQMATLIKAIRAERPANTILIDNGDTWQGSFTSLKTRGEDMVGAMNALGVDLMTAHWEFTYGEKRVKELISKLNFPFLAGNVRDVEFEEPVFESQTYFERSGIKVAVIGQAFPYTPIANPRYMMADWTFGIQEDIMREHIKKAQDDGADLIVLASHNGFDVDRKLASRVEGIDVILTGHTHDAIPQIIRVKDTLLIAAGSHGKFLARLDIEVKNKKIADYSFKMMPVFSDAIKPDPEIAAIVKKIRAPYEKELNTVLGTTDGILYRRGNFNGTIDDLICNAIMQERDTQIAFSPGFRWGSTLLPGTDITTDYIYNQTAITYGEVTRKKFTGAFIKTILEDVGDNLFNKDPYLQQGGDMVRVGGMGFTFDISKPMSNRVSNMTLLSTGDPIDPKKTYIVGGWASVIKGAKGPQIFDLVSDYIRKNKNIHVKPNKFIKVLGA